MPTRTGSELRVSHAERDRVVEVLTVAAGDGRLTAEELDERVGAALVARTAGELAVLTADLPVSEPETKDMVRIEQEGSSTWRGDRWTVPRALHIDSTWGNVSLDFTQAVIAHDTLRIDLDMTGGALRLLIGPGMVVDTDGLVSDYSMVRTRTSRDDTGGPVRLRIEVTGRLTYGKVLTRGPRKGLFR
ncbi:DUF1707 domain-containing protein [Streptomyces sp. NPDC091377]|uniref:DUF1707 SHOCT-like domain-containing protein n=1 Tax=unclassified Streptomyces TaxID=2593676 RepID=UPI00382B3C1F